MIVFPSDFLEQISILLDGDEFERARRNNFHGILELLFFK